MVFGHLVATPHRTVVTEIPYVPDVTEISVISLIVSWVWRLLMCSLPPPPPPPIPPPEDL